MYVQRNIQALSRNHCCSGKAIRITYSECVCVALVFQHAKRMRCILLLTVVCMAVLHFPLYLIKDAILEKKKLTEHKICVFIFSTNFIRNFLILRRNQGCINIHRPSCKIPHSCQILIKLEFSQQISLTILKYQFSCKFVL
jgi:hypothetical protein